MTHVFARRAALAAMTVLGLAAGTGHPAFAQSASSPDALDKADRAKVEAAEGILAIPGVLRGHPDLYYRQLALDAYSRGDQQQAFKDFLYAARFGDKPAQAALASMYWQGQGVGVDRPRAYAWMDLASSRGYVQLAESREYYWSQLNEQERAEAVRVGKDILAQYDDPLTMRRLREKLNAEKNNVTGSRAGFIGNGVARGVSSEGDHDPDQTARRDLSDYYSGVVWDADEYARFKDLQWKLHFDASQRASSDGLPKIEPTGMPAAP